MLRTSVIALLSGCLVVVAACGGDQTPTDGRSEGTPAVSTSTVSPPTATPTPARTPVPTPTPRPETRLELSGAGSEVRTIELEPGLALITMHHLGARNFIVTLRGEADELLANEIGTYWGMVAANAGKQGGVYLLDIEADGPWSLEVIQNQANRPVELGLNFCRPRARWAPGTAYMPLIMRLTSVLPGTTPAEMANGEHSLAEGAKLGPEAFAFGYDT